MQWNDNGITNNIKRYTENIKLTYFMKSLDAGNSHVSVVVCSMSDLYTCASASVIHNQGTVAGMSGVYCEECMVMHLRR